MIYALTCLVVFLAALAVFELALRMDAQDEARDFAEFQAAMSRHPAEWTGDES